MARVAPHHAARCLHGGAARPGRGPARCSTGCAARTTGPGHPGRAAGRSGRAGRLGPRRARNAAVAGPARADAGPGGQLVPAGTRRRQERDEEALDRGQRDEREVQPQRGLAQRP